MGLAGIAVWITGTQDEKQGGGRAPGRTTARASQARGNAAGSQHRPPARKSPRDNPPGSRATSRIVEVTPRRVLATVNGTPLRLEHLVPPSPEGAAVAMESGSFRSRLRRAIEAELVFQAARAKGIGLTEAQQQRLDQIAPGHTADLEELAPYGLSWDTVTGEQINLERTLTEAMMLRQNLVAASDAVAPSPDREEQARYEDALRGMLAQLKSGAVIDMASDGYEPGTSH